MKKGYIHHKKEILYINIRIVYQHDINTQVGGNIMEKNCCEEHLSQKNKSRIIISLLVREGYSTKDISTITNLSVSTVNKYIKEFDMRNTKHEPTPLELINIKINKYINEAPSLDNINKNYSLYLKLTRDASNQIKTYLSKLQDLVIKSTKKSKLFKFFNKEYYALINSINNIHEHSIKEQKDMDINVESMNRVVDNYMDKISDMNSVIEEVQDLSTLKLL